MGIGVEGMCVWEWGEEKGGMKVGGGGKARKLAGAVTWNCKVGGGGAENQKCGQRESRETRQQVAGKTRDGGGLVTAI